MLNEITQNTDEHLKILSKDMHGRKSHSRASSSVSTHWRPVTWKSTRPS